MDIFETVIMRYVATDRSTVMIPQYDIAGGWASLDFLAINLKRHVIYMVEVTSAANIRPLLAKIDEAFDITLILRNRVVAKVWMCAIAAIYRDFYRVPVVILQNGIRIAGRHQLRQQVGERLVRPLRSLFELI